MLIDIYTHIMPAAALDAMESFSPAAAEAARRMRTLPAISDLDARFRQMDAYGDCRQVVMAPGPYLENFTTPEAGAELARVINDATADVVSRHPDRFPAFAATLAMHNPEAAVAETHRAIGDLGARGVQMFSNVGGRALDEPDFEPVFAAAAEHDLPVWLHPMRTHHTTDYEAEPHARYATWVSLGWPYATSVAMLRLAVTGLFDRHPGIKIIAHHMGGMVPFFANRMEIGFVQSCVGTPDEGHMAIREKLERPFRDYLHMFYGDTAIAGSAAAFRCGLEFFGDEHVVFGTDAPYGRLRESVEMIDRLDLPEETFRRITRGNAERLMNMDLA